MRDAPVLKEKTAVDRLRRGSVLMHMHCPTGKQWFVVPGGPLSDETAIKIRKRADIVAQEDGLWPGHSQVWRMVRP